MPLVFYIKLYSVPVVAYFHDVSKAYPVMGYYRVHVLPICHQNL